MSPVLRARERYTFLACALILALVGCGGAADTETAPPASDPGPSVEEAATAVALDGVSFEVHRDPG